MSEDLILPTTAAEKTLEEEAEEIEYAEPVSPDAGITAVVNALSIYGDIDEMVISKLAAKRIKEMKAKCIRLLDYYVNDLYLEVFGEEEDLE